MVMICHCRQINDEALQTAFINARDAKSGGEVVLADIEPQIGDFKCGGCRRIFERAAHQFNKTGEINLFKRVKARERGLCATAASRDYAVRNGEPPDLSRSPIEGEKIRTPAHE